MPGCARLVDYRPRRSGASNQGSGDTRASWLPGSLTGAARLAVRPASRSLTPEAEDGDECPIDLLQLVDAQQTM
jgi:hypothetical protein